MSQKEDEATLGWELLPPVMSDAKDKDRAIAELVRVRVLEYLEAAEFEEAESNNQEKRGEYDDHERDSRGSTT